MPQRRKRKATASEADDTPPPPKGKSPGPKEGAPGPKEGAHKTCEGEKKAKRNTDRRYDVFNNLGTIGRQGLGIAREHDERDIDTCRREVARRLGDVLGREDLLPNQFVEPVRTVRGGLEAILDPKNTSLRNGYSREFKEAAYTLSLPDAVIALKAVAATLGLVKKEKKAQVKEEPKTAVKVELCEGGGSLQEQLTRMEALLQEEKKAHAEEKKAHAATKLELKATQAALDKANDKFFREFSSDWCSERFKGSANSPPSSPGRFCSPGEGKCSDADGAGAEVYNHGETGPRGAPPAPSHPAPVRFKLEAADGATEPARGVSAGSESGANMLRDALKMTHGLELKGQIRQILLTPDMDDESKMEAINVALEFQSIGDGQSIGRVSLTVREVNNILQESSSRTSGF